MNVNYSYNYSSERRTENMSAIIRPFFCGFLFVCFEFPVILLFSVLLRGGFFCLVCFGLFSGKGNILII